jgi:ABC-2 type transport system permease protein
MPREGSPWSGVGAVFTHELADNLMSVRMRLLEVLVFLAAIGAAWAAISDIKETIGEDPFLFLRIFTFSREPLPSFVAFLGFLIPIVAITLGFDSVNGEFNRRTMSRLLAQPIYRDALLFGKFLASLATLAVFLTALWLCVIGFGILLLGLPPSGEEILRGIGFLVASIAYGGVWIALALVFSVVFRSPATAALCALSLWLFFAFFWNMLVPIITRSVVTIDYYDPESQLTAINTALMLGHFSPQQLFGDTAIALFNPATRALGPLFGDQLEGALMGAPLPAWQSFLLIWPQLTALVSAMVVLFTLAYLLFQHQEVRA